MNPANVSGFEIYQLASGQANALTLGNANFARLPAGSITVIGGASGNTINASALAAANAVAVHAGAGNDSFFSDFGHTSIDGGAGFNWMTYTGVQANYAVNISGNVIHGVGGNEVDTLVNVQQMQFSDATVSPVSFLYQQILGRASDGPGVAGWTQVLANGTPLSQIAAAFANSGEAQGDIKAIYQDVLGRPSDNAGQANWTQSLATGTTLAQVRTDIANSGEGRQDVVAVLTSGLGRAPTGAEVTAGQVQLASGLSQAALNQQTLLLANNPTFFVGTGGNTVRATSGVDVFAFGPGAFGQDVVNGFDVAHDVLQISTSQFADYTTVLSRESAGSGGVLLTLDPSNTVLLPGVAASSLTATNFRFI